MHFIARTSTSFFLLIFCFFNIRSDCEAQKTVPFLIGEKLKDSVFNYLANATGLSVTEYKGKLLILDFWNIWCSSCILAMPKLDSLQREFPSDLKIVLVTGNSEKEIEKLFSRIRIKKPSLSMIANDKFLHAMFPHNTVPHHVWINKNGQVSYITDGFHANKQNIEAVINGKQVSLPVKNEFDDFDILQPLIREGNGRLLAHIKGYSMLLERISEYGGSSYALNIRDTANGTTGLKIVNMPTLFLFKVAFAPLIPNGNVSEYDPVLLNNRIRVEMSDDIADTCYAEEIEKLNQWSHENLFCYESYFKEVGYLFRRMQEDISTQFNFDVRIEKRKTTCIVFKSIRNNHTNAKDDNLIKNAGKASGIRRERSQLMKYLLKFQSFQLKPLIDETDPHTRPDLKRLNITKLKAGDIEYLKNELAIAGISITESVEEIDMLIIRKKQSN